MKNILILIICCLSHFATRAQTGNMNFEVFAGLNSGVTPNQTLLVYNDAGIDQFKMSMTENSSTYVGMGLIKPLKNQFYLNANLSHEINKQNFTLDKSHLEERNEENYSVKNHLINLSGNIGVKHKMFHLQTGPIVQTNYRNDSELEQMKSLSSNASSLRLGLNLNIGVTVLNHLKIDLTMQSFMGHLGQENSYDGKNLGFNTAPSSLGLRTAWVF